MKLKSPRVPLSRPAARNERGNTLLVVVTTATLLIGVVGTSILRTTGATRINARASSFAGSARAVDGALEYAYGVWKEAVVQKDAPLVKTVPTDNAILMGAGPAIPGFAYTTPLRIDPVDAYGGPAAAPTRVLMYLPGYPGWRGFASNYLATVRMQSTTETANRPEPTGAKRIFQWIEVPLFQSMYFYEHDLEIYRPAPMMVSGLVHSNSRLLLSGMTNTDFVDLEFGGYVSHAGGDDTIPGYTTKEPPIGGPAWAGISVPQAPSFMEDPTYSSGGVENQVSKVERYEPLGTQPASVLNPNDTNPNNDSFAEIIEPPVTTQPDPPEIAKRRMFNKAGLVFTITGNSVTITAQNGAQPTSGQITSLKAAFTGKNTIYDQREGKNVDTANINVSTMTPVLNSVPGFNGVLYIQDNTAPSGTDPEPKTLRLNNGGKLPDAGLTIASMNPVYVQGDYNTGTTTNPNAVQANATGNPNNDHRPTTTDYTRKPAAIMADAVMLLSNNWNDANATAPVTSRLATNTTYNMAILSGTIPSGYDPDGTGPKGPYGYSGGANNYPRFLEQWTGKSCTYHGSMVELFQSKLFTGKWDTGVIYRPPNRRWNFDTLFVNTPPPGSLDAIAITRGGWSKF